MNTRLLFASLAALSLGTIASTGSFAAQQSGGKDSYGPGITYTQKAAPGSAEAFALIDNENAAGPGIVIATPPTAHAGGTGPDSELAMASAYPVDNRNGH
ncbi:hypothetical protein [Zavarzinia aquatilis]|uniref:Aromatic hydrocarbon degradation protein n=1 Tax=Zavarzinia aquatilis TaxID=2211142 RepID=A0A317EIH8_9PROT|nr:hypothetical protein [Zavarzinia aquatilis]PWR25045.1 hypothetical protein DKG74_04560 [Zavarzinia aquatilis]